MSLLERIVAVFGGALVGGMTVAVVKSICSRMYPMPAWMDKSDPQQVAEFVSGLPVSAFLMLLLAWALGGLAATFVARSLMPNRGLMPALIVLALFLVAVVFNLATIPYPFWLWIAVIIVSIFSGLLGMLLAAPSEYVVSTTRHIEAPIEEVFRTLATIDEFRKAVPGIVNVEFLSDSRYGVGTRFRETRMMNGKGVSTELEVTELAENEYIRIVSDAGGTIWDTIFRVAGIGKQTEMKMTMDAMPYDLGAKLITPLILGMVAKFVEQDMDSVKHHCEKNAA